MQWQTKVQFYGQVKPVGIEKNMNWKTGSVHFDHDAVSGAWMAKLYFKVNPTKVCQQVKIGQFDILDVKCGRLMIENKKGDGIHIKLSSSDIANAKLLVSKIKNSIANTPTNNRAEVGLTPTVSSHKGSENVSPFMNEDYDDLSLFQSNGDISPEHQSGGWLSKKTPPMKNRGHNPPPKRRLELFSPEKERLEMEGKKTEWQTSSAHSFTGMKDYSKRNLNGGNSLSVTNGLGAKSFYGAQNSLNSNNVYRNSHINNSSRSVDRSPLLKRQKLSSSVSLSTQTNKMQDSRVGESTPSSPVAAESNDSTRSIDGSDHSTEVPRRHFRAGETIGFQNLGNTCFLNAPLQCLSTLEPLCLDIQSAMAEYGSEMNRNSITRKLYLLMKDVRKRDVCPDRVKEILIRLRTDMNAKFAPNTQQDAHELLSELLNRVDDEVKAAMRRRISTKPSLSTEGAAGLNVADPEAVQVPSPSREERDAAATPLPAPASICTPTEVNFCWSYRTCIYFHECKTEVVSSQTERETTLMLALDSSTRNIQDCINKYFESTEVEMKCEKCSKDEKATITRKIVRRPRVFILNLLRYHSDSVESTKKADHIYVPSYINICAYCADDVKKAPHIDSVYMLDREANFDLNWLDSVETCRCGRDSSPPSRAGSGTATLSMSVQAGQEDCLSCLTPETEGLDVMISEVAHLEQLVPGYIHPKGLYADILSHPKGITHYPDHVFKPISIDTKFNASVYPENLTGRNFEAPLDFSLSSSRTLPMSSFLSDVVDFGSVSSDIGDQSVIRTSKGPFQSQKSVDKGPAVSWRDKQKDSHKNMPTSRIGQLERPPSAGAKDRSQLDSCLEDEQLLPVLVDFISSNLRAVDKYVEDAQDQGYDLSPLYEDTQTIISEVKANVMASMLYDVSPDIDHGLTEKSSNCEPEYQLLVCEALLKTALNLEDRQLEFAQEDALRQVIEDLIMTRYDHIGEKEKSMDHFIEDLGLCLSAVQCGILKSGADEQKVITERLKVLLGKHDRNNQTELISSDGSLDVEIEVECDDESYVKDVTVMRQKRTVSFRHDADHFIHEGELDEADGNFKTTQDEKNVSELGGGRSFHRTKSLASVSIEDIWKDDILDEDNNNQRKHSPGGTSARTEYLHSPDSTSQMLQGKDINLYSEADLQKVDFVSLTEDEMMAYAQALSRFAYEKEQAAQLETIDAHSVVQMNKCRSFHIAEDGSEDTSAGIKDFRATSEKDCSLTELETSSIDVVEEVVSGTTSRTSPLKTDQSGILTCATTTAATGRSSVTSESHHKSDIERSCESSLLCQEDLSEPEPGTDGHDSESRHIASKVTCKQTSQSCENREELTMASDKCQLPPVNHCVSCGSTFSIECTVCGAMDQTDFDSHPLDTNLSAVQADSLFCDMLNKCITSPNIEPVERSRVSVVKNEMDKAKLTEAHPSSHNPAETSVKESVERNSGHLVSHSSHSGAKKEYLFSPSKTNNLVKSRDYARLRSPAVSPKKRVAKGQQPKPDSVFKQLHFSAEEKLGKIPKTSPDKDESLSGEECSSSELHNTSVEVNIDDASFFENINNCSFVDPSALTVSHHSTPTLNTRMPTSSTSKNMTSSVHVGPCPPPRHVWSGKVNSTPTIPAMVENPNLQQLPPQISQLSDVQIDKLDTSSHSPRVRKISASENMQENIEPENSLPTKLKTSRSHVTSVSEEKENLCRDVTKSSHLENIELGKADLSYKLVGVVDHTGTSQFTGHYTAYAFNMRKQKWFHLNDTETQVVTEDEVREQNTETGYLFFYMDKDLFSEYRDKATTASSSS